MSRIIETEAGRLIGRVDRVQRSVKWSLECPDCALQIPLSDATFTGKQGPTCACGWRGEPFDFDASFETVPPATVAARA